MTIQELGIKEPGIMDRRQILTAGVSALGILKFLCAAGGALAGTFAVVKSEPA